MQQVKEERAEAFLIENYFNKAAIEGLMATMSEDVSREYYTIRDSLIFKQSVEDSLKEVEYSFQRMSSRQREFEGLYREYQDETTQILARKTEKTELQAVQDQFKNYALYQDLKDLYGKVLPPLSTFEAKMEEMGDSYEQSKEMIRRYDEIMSEKASKSTIKEIYEVMRNFVRHEKIKEV